MAWLPIRLRRSRSRAGPRKRSSTRFRPSCGATTRSSCSTPATTRTSRRSRWPAGERSICRSRSPISRSTGSHLNAALNDRTRLVIVNSPHNPSGALLDRAAFDRLAELLRPYDCYLLSDEVYEHVVFDGARHATALAQPELAQRCVAVFSFGKTYHATGWKLGYCVAPPELSAELRRVHQYVTFASTSPLQQALAEYMAEHPEHHLTLPAFYQERRDYFAALLATTASGRGPSRGRISSSRTTARSRRSATSSSPGGSRPSMAWPRSPSRCSTATRPTPALVRFCFAKENSTLDAAAARLRRL